MTDTIYLTYSWQDIPVAKLSSRLTNRFFGPLRWIVLVLALASLFASFTLLRAHLFPQDTGNHLATILAIVACVVTLGLGNTLGHKRLQAALMDAPIRQRDCALAINEHGIAAEGGALHTRVDWSDVIEISELGGFVLIMLSPLEYIPIPLFSLPPDLSRDELLERLHTWHGQAAEAYDPAFA